MRKLAILFLILAAATAAFSQETQKAPQSDAQKAFAKLKSLAGSWQGSIMGIPIGVTIRAASSGTAIIYEANTVKGPPDHEITMFYVEDDRLIAVHYCDAGNRARFEGKVSADGKTLEFTFLDVIGSTKGGLVRRMSFSLSDPAKHLAQFTFVMSDGKPVELSGEFSKTN